MKAIYAEKPFVIGIRDIPCPKITSDEVLIRVRYSGICGSDLHAFRGCHAFRIPPVMLGHEMAGEVVAVGEAVTNISVGENATVMPQIGCGSCVYCDRGETNLCQQKTVPGTAAWNGTFAEYFKAPACVTLPLGTIPCRRGTLAEPLAVAHHVLMRNARSRLNDDLIIWGAGTIGLMILMLAQRYGYKRILITDILDEKLALARELGAAAAVNVARDSADEYAKALFDSHGAGTVILAAGGSDVFDQAIRLTAPGGTIMYFAMITAPVTITTHPIVAKELNILGSVNYQLADFKAAVELLGCHDFPIERIITHEFPAESAQEAFALLDQHRQPAVKILLRF